MRLINKCKRKFAIWKIKRGFKKSLRRIEKKYGKSSLLGVCAAMQAYSVAKQSIDAVLSHRFEPAENTVTVSVNTNNPTQPEELKRAIDSLKT